MFPGSLSAGMSPNCHIPHNIVNYASSRSYRSMLQYPASVIERNSRRYDALNASKGRISEGDWNIKASLPRIIMQAKKFKNEDWVVAAKHISGKSFMRQHIEFQFYFTQFTKIQESQQIRRKHIGKISRLTHNFHLHILQSITSTVSAK